jgi:hypothetical protein
MIDPAQARYLQEQAYLPEHLPGYVQAITGMEPHLVDDFACYTSRGSLVVVGYPLDGRQEPGRLTNAIQSARERFKPGAISVQSPFELEGMQDWEISPADHYYRLDLLDYACPKKVRNMIDRAGRELVVRRDQDFGREHRKLLDEFVRTRRLPPPEKSIFKQVEAYAKAGGGCLIEARDRRGRLAAFDLADFSARDYAFYMFNFRSRRLPIPGASDLLLDAIVRRAQAEGKRYLNLGLGIDPGVVFFKEKWGAESFIPHRVYTWRGEEPASLLGDWLDRL